MSSSIPPAGSVDPSKLADCAICSKQIPQSQVHSHLSTPGHLSQLTQRYHALAKEKEAHTQMIQTLRNVLLKAERTIDQLQRDQEEAHPIAIFDWSGGESDHMQLAGGATLKADQTPPPTAGHTAGTPYPREFIELSRDKQHVVLAPVEFHSCFTFSLGLLNTGWRNWPHYFDAMTIVPGEGRVSDVIQLCAWQKAGVMNGLVFQIGREGYGGEYERCIVEKDALRVKKWAYVTCSIDRGGMMRLYVDGELRGTHQSRFSPQRCVRDCNKMGAKGADDKASESDQNMIGAIATLKIWNDACLGGEEVHLEYLKWASANKA
jgi:hypothetical protein